MKKYVETEKLKEQLKLEAGLGHIQTLADVEKIIDFCGETLQQPQGIDKDRLIEVINKKISLLRAETRWKAHNDGAIEGLEAAKAYITAQGIDQQPTSDGWIPVSERLPEENGRYLCTTKFGFLGTYDFTNDLYSLDNYDFAEYKGKNKKAFYLLDSEWGYSEVDYVIAWQPLPQPYKE